MSQLTRPPSDRDRVRMLAVNAATKPSNVLAGGGVAVAGMLLYALSGAGLAVALLLPLALVVYVVLSVITFFDATEAERIGQRSREERQALAAGRTEETRAQLTPRISILLDAALEEERLLREAIADADTSMSGLQAEVDSLVGALDTIARRANRLCTYLATHDERKIAARLRALDAEQAREHDATRAQLVEALRDQLATLRAMEGQVGRFEAEMEHATAMLSTMHGQLVQMSVDEESLGEQRLTVQVRDLRAQVGAAADAMAEIARTP